MEHIVIEKVTPEALTSLREISRVTFIETFAASNTQADMNRYLENNLSMAELAGELADPESVFFFALCGDDIVGYLKLNTGNAQTELKDQDGLEIERIYVLQAYQGQKVGQVLYEKAVQVALAQKRAYIWLGVWEHNTKAIGFYNKQGFVAFDQHIFLLGDDEQTDIMMKKVLS